MKQNFAQFSCSNNKDEADKRFEYFSSKVCMLLHLVIQVTNLYLGLPCHYEVSCAKREHRYFHPLIIWFHSREESPSKNGRSIFCGIIWVGTTADILRHVADTWLNRYSSNQDISRARQAFFSGQKSFLLISERFHFFRRFVCDWLGDVWRFPELLFRYKVRGVRNIVFYALPDHPQFYTEFLTFPFLDEGVEPSDVTCKALVCKYDRFKLERIVGTSETKNLLKSM